MHLLDPSADDRRVIDGERACGAAAGVGDRAEVEDLAHRCGLLADPTRLAILLALRRAGPIAVSDLALAVGVSPTSASQALRLLRSERAVAFERQGRVVRYRLVDPAIHELLEAMRPTNADPQRHDHARSTR